MIVEILEIAAHEEVDGIVIDYLEPASPTVEEASTTPQLG